MLNQWSVQLNPQYFACNDGSGVNCVVQFVLQNYPNAGANGDLDACIWNINGGANPNDYHNKCLPKRKSSVESLRAFDYVDLAGYTFDDTSTVPATHMLGMVVQYSMTPANAPADPDAVNQIPGLYAVTVEDQYGLAGHWFDATGSILGMGNTGQAQFKNTEVMTLVAGSNCVGDTSASAAICPSQTPLTSKNSQTIYGSTTCETDNLTLVTPEKITWPNANLMVTRMFGSTNVPAGGAGATCLAGESDHVFIKDNDGDNGGTPSNAGGVPFWESPDIFLLPAGAPQPGLNDVAAEFTVELGKSYDLYLRLNNDYGCTDVTNIRVLIQGADPNMGFANWTDITPNAGTGQYQNIAGTVKAGDRAIVGPINWAPSTALAGGHKCLLAAVAAGNQTNPAFPLAAAYKSNQIAQRNLQIASGSTCDYAISNTSTSNAFVLLGVSVSPAASIPGTTGVTLTFDDDAAFDWFATWTAQAGRLPVGTLSVAKGSGQTTVVTLGTSNIALDSVPLAAGSSPKVHIAITSTAGAGAPLPSVDISSVLKGPFEAGSPVLVENGGSCQFTIPPVEGCGEGLTLCGEACVNLDTDASNCGSCGHQCNPGEFCGSGICQTIIIN